MPLYAQVVVDRRTGGGAESFTYVVPTDLETAIEEGRRVLVPFGKRTITGYVLALTGVSEHPAPKPIEALADEPSLLLPYQLRVARWIASYYQAPLTEVMQAMIPPGVRSIKVAPRRKGGAGRRGPRVMTRERGVATGLEDAMSRTGARDLTEDQASATSVVRDCLGQRRGRLLLHGVTGSGKTEVYLAALQTCIEMGLGAIVLIPDISLTPQTVNRFAERFPGLLAVLHSSLTPSEKAAEWRRLRTSTARIAIGPRGAVFAPIPDLGLVIVDEEHSSAYKQLRLPRYHAVDVAYQVAAEAGAVVLSGSATPSVVSFYGHARGETEFSGARVLELPRRFGSVSLPHMEIRDVRHEEEGFSFHAPLGRRLLQLCSEELERGGQMILYLNRRGLAWSARCSRCGESVGCPNCSVSLVYHGSSNRLRCHYCGHDAALPQACPACGARTLRTMGFGTERIEAEARRYFPSARILRLDRDTAATRDAYFNTWEEFAAGAGDILVGTSVVSRGWDLPRVGLVGVVDADQPLHYPDFRAAEEAFSSLVQVGGRARRSGARVLVQTMNPHHYAIRFALEHDYHGFFAEEIAVREALAFPPFTRLIEVTAEASDDQRAKGMATGYTQSLRESLALRGATGIQVLGPSPAFLHRLRGQYRWSVTIKGVELTQALHLLPQGRGFSIDIDPI